MPPASTQQRVKLGYVLRHPWSNQGAPLTQPAAAGATERSTHAATDAASNSSSNKVCRGSSTQAARGMLMWSSEQHPTAADAVPCRQGWLQSSAQGSGALRNASPHKVRAPQACLSFHSRGCPRSRQSGCPCRSWLLLRLRRCLLPPGGSSCCPRRPLPGSTRSAWRPAERSRFWRPPSCWPDLHCTEPLTV